MCAQPRSQRKKLSVTKALAKYTNHLIFQWFQHLKEFCRTLLKLIKFYLKWSKNQDPGPIHYLMAALLVFFECVLFCYKPNKKTVHL